MPSKIAGGSFIRSVEDGYFVANLDTYGGNSGSIVINDATGEAEGILVRGEQDYQRNSEEGCYESVRCEDLGCRGEDVTLISTLMPAFIEYQNAHLNKEVAGIQNETTMSQEQHDIPAVESTDELKVGFYVEHSYIGDLTITLVAPNGNRAIIHDMTGFSQNRIAGAYSDVGSANRRPVEAFANLGPQEAGTWKLEITDNYNSNIGELIYWYLVP